MNRISEQALNCAMLLAVAFVISPIVSVIILAISSDGFVAQSGLSPAMMRYLVNTTVLVLSVSAIALVLGVTTGWLVSMYRFPLCRLLAPALFMPLAVPAYVGAFALVDFLEYAGPVQTALRSIFGWTLASEYYFPEIRSVGGASVVLSLALYPYIYLLTRVSLREQSNAAMEVASTLGAGPYSRFVRVGLPLIRPGIVAGVALVMMETIADFGVVDYFAVQTLTTRIYTVWLEGYDIGAAARVATMILLFVFLILVLERRLKGRKKVHQSSAVALPIERITIRGFRRYVVTAFCLTPFLLGFVLPVSVIAVHAGSSTIVWSSPELGRAFLNSVLVGTLASCLAVAAALFLVHWARSFGGKLCTILLPITNLGYATPGAVIGLGILLPLAILDHLIADAINYISGHEVGMLITGSAAAIVIAYVIRFFAAAQNAVDAAMGRISPSVSHAARSLGKSHLGALISVNIPMIHGSIWTALLIVFVDCVKELPATLLLKPFDFNTLATLVYERASLENITEAAPPALLVTTIGCIGVLLLARTNR